MSPPWSRRHARPGQHVTVTVAARRVQSAIAVLLGTVLGALLTGSAWLHAEEPPPIPEVVDYRMEAYCEFPRNEGEMTVITITNGKTICSVWR